MKLCVEMLQNLRSSIDKMWYVLTYFSLKFYITDSLYCVHAIRMKDGPQQTLFPRNNVKNPTRKPFTLYSTPDQTPPKYRVLQSRGQGDVYVSSGPNPTMLVGDSGQVNIPNTSRPTICPFKQSRYSNQYSTVHFSATKSQENHTNIS